MGKIKDATDHSEILRKSFDRFNIKEKMHVNSSASQPGVILLPRGCLARSGDVFGCLELGVLLLASSG